MFNCHESSKKFLKESIAGIFKLDESKILNIYPYGSRVYETTHSKSDYDYIVVMSKDVPDADGLEWGGNLNIVIFNQYSFEDQLNRHKIASLECIFLPELKIIQNTVDFKKLFKLNKSTLRESISEKASHSWVKAKKKFEVEADRNILVAKKSLFHSMRIIDFGIQIANHGEIKNYSHSSWLWEEIKNNESVNWDIYKNKYNDYYNSQMTKFRKLAPK